MKKIIALALCALLIVPMTFAVSATDDLKDVTLRWDFNDLNEKNGLVSLVANDQSTANEDMVEFNDGVMSILGHAVDYDFSTPIVLDDALANFDDLRCAAALRWLKQEAQHRQILLFTCHSREAEFFAGDEEVFIQQLTETI